LPSCLRILEPSAASLAEGFSCDLQPLAFQQHATHLKGRGRRPGILAGRWSRRVNDTLHAFVARWSASKCHTALSLLSFIRPVTPEVVGSSPVAHRRIQPLAVYAPNLVRGGQTMPGRRLRSAPGGRHRAPPPHCRLTGVLPPAANLNNRNKSFVPVL
jgi:hypothetical protein